MAMKPKRRDRTSFWEFLLAYGVFAVVPLVIVGLLACIRVLEDGFTLKRLAVIAVSALAVLAGLWTEKNEDRLRARIRNARSDPAGDAGGNKPGPAGAAGAGAKRRQIDWGSGVLDDIGRVYERAEKDDKAAGILSQLETQALAEARRMCGLVPVPGEKLTPEGFDRLSAAQRETVIARLGEKGIQDSGTDAANGKIDVTLSPVIGNVVGCTVFWLLNWLEKLDGTMGEAADGKVMLSFRVPLGGRKGLVQWEMLILRLYPWLRIHESASTAVTVALSGEKPEGGAAKAAAGPSGTAVPSEETDLPLDDALRVLRDKIIARLAGEPGKRYELTSLAWDEAARCFPGGPKWDLACFFLELDTRKLCVEVSTYPNQFGACREGTFGISAADFHRKALEFGFDPELRRLRTEADWALLFDETLKAAVTDAFEAVRWLEAQKEEELREEHAIRIPSGMTASPKMNIRRIVLKLNQPYGGSGLTLTRENDTYLLCYEGTSISEMHNKANRREVRGAEAAWIEERVDRAVRDPDDSTWQSLPGGDTMSVEIQRKMHADIALTGGQPMRKYSDLLRDLGYLVMYGSVGEKAADGIALFKSEQRNNPYKLKARVAKIRVHETFTSSHDDTAISVSLLGTDGSTLWETTFDGGREKDACELSDYLQQRFGCPVEEVRQ